jgi:hypothetical protein
MPVSFQLALEYTIKKIHENQKRMKINGDHQLLVCAEDVNLLGENITTGIKEAGLQINAE